MVALFTTAYHFGWPWPAHTYAVLNKYPNPLAPHVVSMDVVDRQILPDGTIRSERILGIQQDSPRWVRRILGTPDVTYAREVSFVVPSCVPNPADPAPLPKDLLLEPPKLLMASTNLSMSSLLQCREAISYIPHPWPHLPPPTREQFAPALSVRDEDSADDSGSIPGEGNGDDDDDSNAVPPYPSPTATDHPLSHPALPPTTLFSQSALIFSTGVLATERYPPHGVSRASPIAPLSRPAASTFPQRAAGRRIEEYSKQRFEENATGGRAAMQWAAGRLWREIETPEGGE